ncbi:hypothetical protein MTBLM1_20272 [Rhodospirillaceae bacterium LM-1]|nr:hypothetical protein MTBLM1_20272 [Rhodospirillaceae bacterium LM-1]
MTEGNQQSASGPWGPKQEDVTAKKPKRHLRLGIALIAFLLLIGGGGYWAWKTKIKPKVDKTLLGQALQAPESFPIRITVELEYQGKPVVLTRINRCVPYFQRNGMENSGSYFFVNKIGGMGTVLPDGSAVFMRQPNACKFISLDERKTKQIKYGYDVLQPLPSFVPAISWAPDAKDLSHFEQYFLKEAVSEPGSRIIYKGTKVERLQPSDIEAENDGFSWYTHPSELFEKPYESGKTKSFFAYFLVSIPEEELKAYPEVTSYINEHVSPADGGILPDEFRYKLKALMFQYRNKNFFLGTS